MRDRVALVSGVGPGLGRDIALALAREGADVVLGARTAERLKAVAAEVEAMDRRAVFAPTDITVEDDCHALADLARDEFGRLDVLVNNAFVQPPFETLEEASIETWQQSFDVNLLGQVRMTKAVLPLMKQQRRGSIVFVSSMSARRMRRNFGIYSAAKSALLTTARMFAVELGGHGIRVNSILPGYIWGPSVERYFQHLARRRGITPEAVYEDVASETCLGRLPTSAEVADSVLYLASDLSRAVTGHALDVNAGHWLA
jgi:NAD(P)-dependent dehydrogenase (short-subunit alcohol dehydrogenase family)